MLKKCLKYDLKAIFRIWWIAAVSVLGLAVGCGFAVRGMILNPDSDEVFFVQIMLITASVFALVAFVVLSSILYLVRYYSNFFKDEGYLTFTLPVKRQTLFLSKLISALTVQIATLAVIGLSVGIVLLMAPYKTQFSMFLQFFGIAIPSDTPNILAAIMVQFGGMLEESIAAIGPMFWVFVAERVIGWFLNMVVGTLTIFFAITMGATVAKKQKVLASIGLYYAITTVSSTIMQITDTLLTSWVYAGMEVYGTTLFEDTIGFVFGFMGTDLFGSTASQIGAEALASMALMLLLGLVLSSVQATVFGFATLGTLERKLNLQ